MKTIITSVAGLAITTVYTTAKLSGLSTSLVTGTQELGSITPDPSTCGIIGAFTLIGIIGARRLNARG